MLTTVFSVQVYSVGVGLNRIAVEDNLIRALDELESIAQPESNFFLIDEFNQLSSFLRNVTQIACEQLCANFVQEF